jgi:hypothetical protein
MALPVSMAGSNCPPSKGRAHALVCDSGCDAGLQVDRVETAIENQNQKVQDQQHQHQGVLQLREQHHHSHQSVATSTFSDARAVSSSPARVLLLAPQISASESDHRSPSPSSLAGSSSGIRHEHLNRVGSGSRLLCSLQLESSAFNILAGALVAEAPLNRLHTGLLLLPSQLGSKTCAHRALQILRKLSRAAFCRIFLVSDCLGSAAVAAHSNGVRLDVMPSTCAFRPPSPPTSSSRSRSSSIGGSSKIAWKASPQPEHVHHMLPTSPFHRASPGSSPDEPMPVPHREVPRPIPSMQSTTSRTSAAEPPPRPATHGVAAAGGVSRYMPPKLSTLAPKLKGGTGSAGSGARPSTTHAATAAVGKETKAVKPYNATGSCIRCQLAPHVMRSRATFLNLQTTRNTCATPFATACSPDPFCSASAKMFCTGCLRATTCNGFCCSLATCHSRFALASLSITRVDSQRSCGACMAFRLTGFWPLPWAQAPP